MNTALALIKKCLANKEPVLNLGNCGLIDEDLRIGSEVGQQLAQCTHITKLVLSNREYEWELDNTPRYEIDLRYRDEYRKVNEQLPYENSWPPKYFFYLRDKRPVIPFVLGNMNHFIAIREVVAVLYNLEEFVCGGEYEERWEISLIECINTSQERKIKVSIEGNDQAIDLGADWDVVIKREIEKSDLALLFVSASYVASPYFRKEKLGTFFKKMQEGKFTMLPVLLRDCDFASFEAFSGLQFFQATFLDYGFKQPAIRNKFMSFDVLKENEDATDQQLNSYNKNLADKIFDTVNNKF